MIVYRITNTVNGMSYVGQTIQRLSDRLSYHRRTARTHLGRAIRKYGWGNFFVEVLQECSSVDDLNAAEVFWIETLLTLHPNGYNHAFGGGNRSLTEEHRKKIGDAQRGRKQSEETRRRKSEALKGRPITWQDKLSAAAKNRETPPEMLEGLRKGREGRIVSEAFRIANSKNSPTRVLSEEQVREIRRLWATGEFTQAQLAPMFGVKQPQIGRVVRRVAYKWIED